MTALRAVADMGKWDATQWVALFAVAGALIGPLLGVWFGKRLEKAAQREAHHEAERLKTGQSLKEALIQVEVLLPNIDSTLVLKKIYAGLPLPDIAAAEESKSLYAQEERVQLLLVQASMLIDSQEAQTQLEQLRMHIRDGVLTSVALLSEIARGAEEGERSTVLQGLSAQLTGEIRSCINAIRVSLNMSLPRRPLPSKATIDVWAAIQKDRRVVETPDVLSQLRGRPNLMDLGAAEFEALIANLFAKIGYQTALTGATGDRGVDILAVDRDPLSGGKVIIVAKKYGRRVAVEAVRDLYGAMAHEGAVKGILVTTSDFGPSSYAFAEGKPIELLSGSNLIYLLERYAGIQARIEVE
jgi:hypothetical protein